MRKGVGYALNRGCERNRGSENSAKGPENQDQNPLFRTLPTLTILYISTIIQAYFLRNLHEGPTAVSRNRKIGPESPLPDSVRPQSPHS